MSPQEPVIEVDNLSKSYQISHKAGKRSDTIKDSFANLIKHPFKEDNGDKHETFWALKDVSFSVNKGEVFGIVGRNGSGKSTMLKILSRIVTPTNGSASLRGRTASLLEVGTGFHPELTGRENIYFNGSMLGMSRKEIKSKFDEIVAFSEVEKFIDTPVKFYSSGMYVRLAFSVAAHLEPDILILDEVLAVGDAAFQRKSLNKIVSSMEEGRTVLFVSHSMGAVQQICSRGILLNKGQVAYSGPADELAAHYNEMLSKESPVENVLTEWTPDQAKNTDANEFFELKGIKLESNGKHFSKPVKSSDSVEVHIDIDLKKTSEDLMIGYAIYSGKSLLYFSYSEDHPSKYAVKLKPGRQTISGKIPDSLLNSGQYRIAIVASIHNKLWIYPPGDFTTPSVQFVIKGGLAHAEYWKEAREGYLAPDIEWRLDA